MGTETGDSMQVSAVSCCDATCEQGLVVFCKIHQCANGIPL